MSAVAVAAPEPVQAPVQQPAQAVRKARTNSSCLVLVARFLCWATRHSRG